MKISVMRRLREKKKPVLWLDGSKSNGQLPSLRRDAVDEAATLTRLAGFQNGTNRREVELLVAGNRVQDESTCRHPSMSQSRERCWLERRRSMLQEVNPAPGCRSVRLLSLVSEPLSWLTFLSARAPLTSRLIAAERPFQIRYVVSSSLAGSRSF